MGITIDVDGNFSGYLTDDIPAGIHIIKVPTNASSPVSYKFTGNIDNGAVIQFIDENTGLPYSGQVDIKVDKTTGAKFDINLPSATVNFFGNVGSVIGATSINTLRIINGSIITNLTINQGNVDIDGTVTNLTLNAAVNVTANVGSVALSNITNPGNAKFFWRVHNGTQLRTALAYPAAFNNGIVMAGNCDFNSGGTPGVGSSVDQQAAFHIALADDGAVSKAYTGYIFDGNGYILSGTASNQVLICYTDNAIIKNVTITAANKNMNGLTIYNSTGVELDNVNAINNGKAGIIINGSVVTMSNVHTNGNGWGGVNIDKPGAGLTFDETCSFAEAAKVWADHVSTNTYIVNHPASWTSTPIPARDQTIYHPIAASGAVSLNGTPYATIAAALAVATTGDVVYVGDGTFNENISVPAGVAVAGINGTILTGTISLAAGSTIKDFKHEWNSTTKRPIAITASNVTVENVEFTYTGTETKMECILTNHNNVQNVIIKNCTFTGHWKALYMNTCEGFQILNNTFNKTTIATDNYSTTMVIKGNFFNRTSILQDTQVPHIIVPAAYTGNSNNTDNWTSAFKTKLNEILNDNTWANPSYKSIRVQQSGATWNKYIKTPF